MNEELPSQFSLLFDIQGRGIVTINNVVIGDDTANPLFFFGLDLRFRHFRLCLRDGYFGS